MISLTHLLSLIFANKMNMEEHKTLNIVMFPWLAFGHMIPFLELSKHLATKGHHVYFVSTPRNLERLPKIPQILSPSVTLVSLPLPRVENLPHNAEATSDVGFEMGKDLLKQAYDGLQEPMTNFLKATVSSHPIDWIIYDFTCYWLPSIADSFGIGKVFFSIFIARLLSGAASLWSSPEILSRPPSWIPFKNSSVYFLPHEARMDYQGLTKKTCSGVTDIFRFQTCMKSCDLVAVRSCMELEGEHIQLVQKLNEKPVFPVGLLSPSMNESQEDAAWNSINRWLEKQRNGTVVYVAFGSEVEPSQDLLTELALGLELSRSPFFWAFRRSGISSLLLPEGFEERTRDRGLVWASWAPQLKILSHDSVGGILTHCGWSSIIETLMFGKPLIMLPLVADQGINARFMTEMKVGVEIPRTEEDGSVTRSSVAELLTLVLQGKAGMTYKDEAKKVATIFADKDVQSQYIESFSDNLYDHKHKS